MHPQPQSRYGTAPWTQSSFCLFHVNSTCSSQQKGMYFSHHTLDLSFLEINESYCVYSLFWASSTWFVEISIHLLYRLAAGWHLLLNSITLCGYITFWVFAFWWMFRLFLVWGYQESRWYKILSLCGGMFSFLLGKYQSGIAESCGMCMLNFKKKLRCWIKWVWNFTSRTKMREFVYNFLVHLF